MKATITKTTTTRTASTYKKVLTDDDGKTIATMTGTVDSARPLGNTNLIVTNRALYNQHADAVKAQYAAFQAAVAAAYVEPQAETDTSEEEIAE